MSDRQLSDEELEESQPGFEVVVFVVAVSLAVAFAFGALVKWLASGSAG